MEEVLKLLEKKGKKHGERGRAFVEDVKPLLERVYKGDPVFARKFAESVPASYLGDPDNAEAVRRLLEASSTVLEARIEPARELTQILLDLILAANRRCHTSTKYHVFHLINNVGREVGVFGVAQAAREVAQKLGSPSRSNAFRFVRTVLLYSHPKLRFSLEEAVKNYKIAGIAYLVRFPEFRDEWVEVLRRGGDVWLSKGLSGEFRIGTKWVLLTNSLRRILEAYDVHHSCFSPHYASTNFLTVVKHPSVITITILGKRGQIVARMNGYHDLEGGRLFIGSKIYGNLSKEEALRIFRRIGEEKNVEVWVPEHYIGKAGIGKDITVELPIEPPFGISDDFVSLGREIQARKMVKL